MRTPMVTRTICTTKVTVLCLDLEKAEPYNETFTLPRTYKNEDAILKALEPFFPDKEKVKPVHVVETEVIETLYGMSEQDFINNATVLPPRKERK